MSSSTERRRAIIAVAEKLRTDESVNLPDAVVGAAGDMEHNIEQAFRAALAKDTEALKKNLRDGMRQGMSLQMSLPGMDHATLPTMVIVKDKETGEEFAKPSQLASLDEIDVEIRKARRAVEIQDRVVSGWEATSSRARELGATGDWTGAELEVNFPREIQ